MMAVAYSKEFRREVLAACDSGRGTREVALSFDVSESWVRRIKQERRELGKTAPKQTRNRRPSGGFTRTRSWRFMRRVLTQRLSS